jgi:hypothetical protein
MRVDLGLRLRPRLTRVRLAGLAMRHIQSESGSRRASSLQRSRPSPNACPSSTKVLYLRYTRLAEIAAPELNPGVNTLSSGLCAATGVVHPRSLAAADLARHSDA